MMRRSIQLLLLAVIGIVPLVGCYQGRPSDDPPIHFNPSMDIQPKYKAQSSSDFFADGSTMRLPVEGTVAREELLASPEFSAGVDERGDTVSNLPVPLTMELMRRGQQRYNIYCSPCHGQVGDGKGIIVQRGMLPPPSFHDPRIRAMKNGHYFDVISSGIRNMPSYRYQVDVADRWAIVAYMRALQRSRNAAAEDLPDDVRERMGVQDDDWGFE